MQKELPGLGPTSLVPTRSAALPKVPLAPEEGFVLSRIDGHTSLAEICLLVPLGTDVVTKALLRLVEVGAIELPKTVPLGPAATSVTLPPKDVRAAAAAAVESIGLELDAPPSASADSDAEEVSEDDVLPQSDDNAKVEGTDLTVRQVRRINEFYNSIAGRDPFEMLEVDHKVDRRGLKKAYFALSKEFHPDRFYGRELGLYARRLSGIFQALKSAYELLSDSERRKQWENDHSLEPETKK